MEAQRFRHTAVLIDFENFFLARESQLLRAASGASYQDMPLATDLRSLVRYCKEVSGNSLRVLRAYSDYTARREVLSDRADPASGPPRYDYYLSRTPRTLVELGIEPIQVFRYSSSSHAGRGSKNAVDIRMAMDASSLCREEPRFDLLILVSGDADFIPVVVDCRRHGTRVFGIGVGGSTNRNIEEFCDRYEDFSELEAYINLEDEGQKQLARTIEAIRKVLTAKRHLPAAALRPELNKVLPVPFDPGTFGCQTTGEFLREYDSQLRDNGIMVRRSLEGWVVEVEPETWLPPESTNTFLDGITDRDLTPPAEGSTPPQPPLRPRRFDGPNYRQLLQMGPTRYYVYPRRTWMEAARIVLRALDTFPSAPTYDELTAAAKDMAAESEIPPLTVSACSYGICAARGLVPVDTFQTYRRVDKSYHWVRSREVETKNHDESAEFCFRKFVQHLANELRQRLAQRQSWATLPVDPQRLAALWSEGDPSEEDIAIATEAIASLSTPRQ